MSDEPPLDPAGLEARALVKSYRARRVVDHVSFRVNPGEVVGLLGPNGAGKSTSFAIVAATGDIYAGLWYPIVVALATALIGALFLRETHRSPLPD